MNNNDEISPLSRRKHFN